MLREKVNDTVKHTLVVVNGAETCKPPVLAFKCKMVTRMAEHAVAIGIELYNGGRACLLQREHNFLN